MNWKLAFIAVTEVGSKAQYTLAIDDIAKVEQIEDDNACFITFKSGGSMKIMETRNNFMSRIFNGNY